MNWSDPLRQTCWYFGEKYVPLEKKLELIGYDCCQVLARGTITTRCWSCGEHTGRYYNQIPHSESLKHSNPYAALDHFVSPIGHIPRP